MEKKIDALIFALFCALVAGYVANVYTHKLECDSKGMKAKNLLDLAHECEVTK